MGATHRLRPLLLVTLALSVVIFALLRRCVRDRFRVWERWNEQRQRKKQIPRGNDRKKSKSNDASCLGEAAGAGAPEGSGDGVDDAVEGVEGGELGAHRGDEGIADGLNFFHDGAGEGQAR